MNVVKLNTPMSNRTHSKTTNIVKPERCLNRTLSKPNAKTVRYLKRPQEKVTQEDIDEVSHRFSELDKDRSGFIEFEEC